MDKLNPEQVRALQQAWDVPLEDLTEAEPDAATVKHDILALCDSWLVQGEALAAAQQENQKLRGVLKEVSECCSCGYDLVALASLSNSPTEE